MVKRAFMAIGLICISLTVGCGSNNAAATSQSTPKEPDAATTQQLSPQTDSSEELAEEEPEAEPEITANNTSLNQTDNKEPNEEPSTPNYETAASVDYQDYISNNLFDTDEYARALGYSRQEAEFIWDDGTPMSAKSYVATNHGRRINITTSSTVGPVIIELDEGRFLSLQDGSNDSEEDIYDVKSYDKIPTEKAGRVSINRIKEIANILKYYVTADPTDFETFVKNIPSLDGKYAVYVHEGAIWLPNGCLSPDVETTIVEEYRIEDGQMEFVPQDDDDDDFDEDEDFDEE